MHSGGPRARIRAYNRAVRCHGVAILALLAACDRGSSGDAEPVAAKATGAAEAVGLEAGKAGAGKAGAGKAEAGKAEAGKTEAGEAVAGEAEAGKAEAGEAGERAGLGGVEPAVAEPHGNTAETPTDAPRGLAAVVADTRERVAEEGAGKPTEAELAAGGGVAWKPTPAELKTPPRSAASTSTGLHYQVLHRAGGTNKPGANDKVEVNYVGWHTDGEEFDSSIARGRPAKFPLDKVIKGWTEGVQLMAEGDVFRFWIPESLAYEGRPGKPAGMLIFDIELMSFEDLPDPPKAPADVAAPPSDATVTASGLAYKVITPGHGKTHPTETGKVEVHYSGWTTDGKMFDSSVTRGRSATFPLNRVIKGWTEAVQLMVEGEKTIFWIPESLAYEGKPGKPMGMLVFEIELIAIK